MIEINRMAEDLKLLGDKTRLSMMSLLKSGERCVCEFVERYGISQSAVSQHLSKLRNGGLVKERKQGSWVYYSLNIADKPHISAVLQYTSGADVASAEQNETCTKYCCE